MSARSFKLDKVRQGNITVLDQGRSVQLHSTIVAKIIDYNKIQLNSGGWLTVTTKTAINRFFELKGLNARISQNKGVWYVTVDNKVIEYNDNMIVEF